MSGYQQIVCATDFSARSEPAVAHADELATRFGATLHLIHVVEDVAVPSCLPRLSGVTPADLLEEWMRKAEADLRAIARRCTAHVVTACRFGHPAPEILDYVRFQHADLLVVGSHGRRGLATVLLGSVAERLVQQATCPVLLVGAGLCAERPAETRPSHTDT
jgi:universal stress protein A